jgi:hypothetical protein
MTKIKISAIILLALFGIFVVFLNIIPVELMMLLLIISFCLFIFLSIQSFKIGGMIKKLSLWADITTGLMILSALVPKDSTFYLSAHYSIDLLLLVIAGLLVAILVQTYKKQAKLG